MNKPIYWSHLKAYEACPQSFLWGYGYEGIDLGNGPGKKKTAPLRSAHHALMGNVIGKTFESFYNEKWYLRPTEVVGLLSKEVERVFEKELKRTYIKWDAHDTPSRDELFKTCKDGILGYLKTLKEHKLVGSLFTASEWDMKGWVDDETWVGGRSDLQFKREDTGLSILDGKNGKRYSNGIDVDPDQLKWYALCSYLFSGEMPDRLGFIFFRYPAGQPVLDTSGKPTGEVETGVQWIPFSTYDIDILKERAKATAKGMKAHAFAATPSTKACKWCDFKDLCDERKAWQEANRLKRGKTRNPSGIVGIFSLSLEDNDDDEPVYEVIPVDHMLLDK